MHFSGILIAQSVKIRSILLRNSPRSASSTEAKPSRLLSKEDVDFSPTRKIRDSSRSSISWFSDTLLRFLYARSKNVYRIKN